MLETSIVISILAIVVSMLVVIGEALQDVWSKKKKNNEDN